MIHVNDCVGCIAPGEVRWPGGLGEWLPLLKLEVMHSNVVAVGGVKIAVPLYFTTIPSDLEIYESL